MIVYPVDWRQDYSKYVDVVEQDRTLDRFVDDILQNLYTIIKKIGIYELAYSGGIDSSVLLSVMTYVHGAINTYTISCREDHKDVLFAKVGSEKFSSNHHIFIVEPTTKDTDIFRGDNAVRQFYEQVSIYTNSIICGDGVDEFMCGYYKHQDLEIETYKYFLKDLLPGHLMPLNNNSKAVEVCLPYLSNSLTSIMSSIPFSYKVDKATRKKVMVALANRVGVPLEIISRNKYGFIDAFLDKDK